MKKKRKNKWDKARLEEMGEHADALNPKVVVNGEPHLTMQPDRAKVHVDRYKFVNELSLKKSVIDCPCGFGYASKILDYTTYLGLDISETSIPYAIDRYGTKRVQFVNADATKKLELEPVDTVISIEGIEHVFEPEKMIQNFHRWTNKQLIISAPHNWGVNAEMKDGKRVGGGYHLWNSTADSLIEMVEDAGFKVNGRYCIDNEAQIHSYAALDTVHLPCVVLDCEKK